LVPALCCAGTPVGVVKEDRRSNAKRGLPSHALNEAQWASIVAIGDASCYTDMPSVRIVPAPAVDDAHRHGTR